MGALDRYGTTLRVYDNAGKTLDRYTIIPPRNATEHRGNGAMNGGAPWGWACIVSGVDPRGVSGHATATPGPHLGRRIAWDALPEAVQRLAARAFPEFVFDLETVARHFCIAAQWADCPEGTNPRTTRQALRLARDYAREFMRAHPTLTADAMACEGYGAHPDAGSPEAAFGHDLYLTARGHGVGFWCRDVLGATGEKLGDVMDEEWRRWYIEPEFYGGWMRLHANAYNKESKA